MVNFSDLELDSYQLRNLRASSRKEMLPGWVLAFPPRPQITSWWEGASFDDLETGCESDGSDVTLSAIDAVDDEMGESGWIKYLELSPSSRPCGKLLSAAGGGSVGISLFESLLIPPNTLL
mmetsp:Transcript_39078/g.94067  ORF Transcript_39078/g.94067 Transcript_39078/m.94067 type:complete len:121 (-) Transcript_39078:21-383(-)